MSTVGEMFLKSLGKPNPSQPIGLTFSKIVAQMVWKDLQKETGAGWYLNRFLYLFGEDLKKLHPCLEAWSFLFEKTINRVIIGKNAYGSLLVIEEPEIKGINAPVGLIDPWRVNYWRDDNLGFINLIGHWLPENKIPGFLETSLFESWQQTTQEYLEFLNIIAIKVPFPLGGEMEANNFQVENILEYYETTGPIYKKALERKT